MNTPPYLEISSNDNNFLCDAKESLQKDECWDVTMTVMTGYKNIFVQLHQHISTPIITPWGHHLPLGHPSNHGAGAQAWTARRHRWSGPGSWSSQRWRLWGRAKGPTLKPPKKLIGGMGWLLVVINGYIIYIEYIYIYICKYPDITDP